jgi:hypothetical protein
MGEDSGIELKLKGELEMNVKQLVTNLKQASDNLPIERDEYYEAASEILEQMKPVDIERLQVVMSIARITLETDLDKVTFCKVRKMLG